MPLIALDGVAPELPPEGDYWIAPSAYVIGRVSLGRGCSVWFGSVLRGDNGLLEIGEETNIQENCIFHTDIGVPFKVGKGCTIGHRALLHGCRVGDNCLVGIGATILNNTVIGDNCLIGAHTLLPEGKAIPPGSLVMGSPGKVVRTLSEREIEGLRHTSRHYIENMRRFQALF
ncbi:MAG TPA: gamma carbonic anhydrase family protein [Hyphomicrobiales bacterium]|nr:gamma carbonic anhydrase family protein [Hyphomicrobiales bacterium]